MNLSTACKPRQSVFDRSRRDVRVIGFNGRESDAKFGLWGELAEQLGKKEVFRDLYSPLSAPGTTAWINLLKGEPTIIFLDELPPYFANAKAREIGETTLAHVTNTALSNLMVAVDRPELSNVCVVISDLRASYEDGSNELNQALDNLANEANRSSIRLEPVNPQGTSYTIFCAPAYFLTYPMMKQFEKLHKTMLKPFAKPGKWI